MPHAPELPPHQPRQGSAPPPLRGIRIVDFTRVLAGPFATQMLGDLGAEIIKVEQPGTGDDTRSVRTQGVIGGETAFFLAMNRSKRSIAIDLKQEEGRQVVLDLVATADVLVENFTAPVMRRFGLDHATLCARFPQLIYCSISAYGRSGSKADAAGYDFPIAAEAGLTSLNANAGEAPVAGMVPFVDLSTAYNAVIGIQAALLSRAQTGRGQHVDVAMFDTALANLAYHGLQYLATGEEPRPSPERTARPRGLFETADGAVVLAVTGAKMFRAFCDVVWRLDWLDDPRFADEAFRMADRTELLPQICEILKREPSAVWSERCERAGIPCGAVRTPGAALSSPEARERGLAFGLPHPRAGVSPAIAHGFRLSEAPFDYRAPPVLAADSRAVLTELGYDGARIDALVAGGAVGEAR